MDDEPFELLERFYDRLRDVVEAEGKLRSGSLITRSMDVKNNTRASWLRESSISAQRIDPNHLRNLLDSGLVREASEISKYVISAKGLWEVEKKRSLLDDDRLVGYIDSKFFDIFETQTRLSEKEKVIIMSLLAARSFAPQSPVDLHKDEATMDAWKRIVESVYDRLSNMRVISKLGREDLFGKKGNEHPVSNLIRHTDALPRKTKMLYKAAGNQQYYLDLFDGARVSTGKLGHLFWLVFEDRLNTSNIDDVFELCQKIAYSEGIFVFDLSEHRFSSHEYDDAIREGLKESILSAEHSMS
jgi:hypothetical protein